ncbi:MAG: heme-binding domain-containing protein [Bacteroidales bacterium]|nr:heme-binding domain-containing protein [Bacteroidota bacterium]MCF8348648.1 heme-binding domain-containing protein [Bacteroidales bacterium]
MKKYVLFVLALAAGLLFIRASYSVAESPAKTTPVATGIDIPENVQAVIDNSCYGCHYSESKNEKGKKKLMFDKLDELSRVKLIGKLTGIADVIASGDMPPKKVLVDHPDMALTDETAKTLTDWATEKANGLMD